MKETTRVGLFDKESWTLAASCHQDSADGAYELIAVKKITSKRTPGLDEIPAIVENVGDKDASTFALIENLQREDLNPLEEASGYHRLQEEFGLTQDDLAKLVGKSRSTVATAYDC